MMRTRQTIAFGHVRIGLCVSRSARTTAPANAKAPANADVGLCARATAKTAAPSAATTSGVRGRASAGGWVCDATPRSREVLAGFGDADVPAERLLVAHVADRRVRLGVLALVRRLRIEPVEHDRARTERGEDSEHREHGQPDAAAARGDGIGRRLELLDEDPLLHADAGLVLLPRHPLPERLRGRAREGDRVTRLAGGCEELDDRDLGGLVAGGRRSGEDRLGGHLTGQVAVDL